MIHYAAFYADCEHELEEITEGVRIVLAYNLIYKSGANNPKPNAERAKQKGKAFHRVIQSWVGDSDGPQKFGLLLSHKYTMTNLSFIALKGEDKDLVNTLTAVKAQDGVSPLFDVHLCLVEKYETGYADYDGGGIIDGGDITTQTVLWVGPDGPIDNRLELDLDEEFLGEDEAFNEYDEPDKKEKEEYTGNAGPSVEYWYYKAFLVFWPKVNSICLYSSAGLFSNAIAMVKESSDLMKALSSLLESVEQNCKARQLTDSNWASILQLCQEDSMMIHTLRFIQKQQIMPGPFLVNGITSRPMSEDAMQVWYEIVCKAVKTLDVNAAPTATAIFKYCIQVVENKNAAGEEVRWLGLLTRCMNAIERCHLLRHVLSDCCVQNRIREGCAHCRHIASIRVTQLNSPEPTFSWCMPNASMPSHPDVERFLRGPNQSYTVRGLNGITHARNFAAKYCNGNAVKDGYSMRSTDVGGTGQNAYVTMMKTKPAFDTALQSFNEEKREKKMLLNLLNVLSLDAENVAPDDSRNVRQRCDGGEIIDLCMDD
jgi:hypothetical protein